MKNLEKKLKQLPSILERLSKKWSLTDLKPVPNMSYNYVALATQNKTNPVVLKVSCDAELIASEHKALQHFGGHGSIQVFNYDTDYHALLLEQGIPGHLLTANPSIERYAETVKQLAQVAPPKDDCEHARD